MRKPPCAGAVGIRGSNGVGAEIGHNLCEKVAGEPLQDDSKSPYTVMQTVNG